MFRLYWSLYALCMGCICWLTNCREIVCLPTPLKANIPTRPLKSYPSVSRCSSYLLGMNTAILEPLRVFGRKKNVPVKNWCLHLRRPRGYLPGQCDIFGAKVYFKNREFIPTELVPEMFEFFWSISGTEFDHFWNWLGKNKIPGALHLLK